MNLQSPKTKKEELLIPKEKEITIPKKSPETIIPAQEIMGVPKRNDYAVIAKEIKYNFSRQINAEMQRVLTQFYTGKSCECTIHTNSSIIQNSDMSYVRVCFKCLGHQQIGKMD